MDDLRAHLAPGSVTLLLGILRDKEVARIVEALRSSASLRDALVVATDVPDSPRALAASDLAAAWGRRCDAPCPSSTTRSGTALDAARSSGGPIVVCGSLYLVGHVRGRLIGPVPREHGRQPPPPIRIGPVTFDWGTRTYVMGILNLTPDSFSGDGLADAGIAAAVEQARRMVTTAPTSWTSVASRPGLGICPVPVDEERGASCRSSAPSGHALPDVPLSVDTTQERGGDRGPGCRRGPAQRRGRGHR